MTARTVTLDAPPASAREIALTPSADTAQTTRSALERGWELSTKLEERFAEANTAPRVTRDAVSDLMALCYAAADQYELAQSLRQGTTDTTVAPLTTRAARRAAPRPPSGRATWAENSTAALVAA